MAEYEDALCPQCHQLQSVCSDPETPFYPQLHMCLATAATAASTRRWHDKHKDTKPSAVHHMLPTDGGLVWVSTDDLTPDDTFLD